MLGGSERRRRRLFPHEIAINSSRLEGTRPINPHLREYFSVRPVPPNFRLSNYVRPVPPDFRPFHVVRPPVLRLMFSDSRPISSDSFSLSVLAKKNSELRRKRLEEQIRSFEEDDEDLVRFKSPSPQLFIPRSKNSIFEVT
tara:strand:- start:1861 stop:2283 length:423 start_codon:yes stop_codon:yes gene_type:complete